MENGLQKKVTEQYLVDALSCTEAEARTIEELQPFMSGEFKVKSVSEAKLSDTFFGDGDRYYKAKINMITLDGNSGHLYVLIQANNFDESLTKLKDGMKNSMADYEIASITETAIMDVFEFKA